MQAGCSWLKDGGILTMHVQQRYIPRAICEKPPLLQFYHILSIESPYYEHVTSGRTIFQEEWRPIVVYVKGARDTHPIATQKASNDHVVYYIGSEVFSNEREFADEMIKRLSPENSTIVEPFMGQSRGTVGMASMYLGRTYIGIERETSQFLSAMNMLYNE